MTSGFTELTVGDVVFAPFVKQAIIALAIFLLIRPLYRLLPIENTFSNPPLIGLCLFVVILAAVMVIT